MEPITPQLLLRAYASGIFPMSEDRDDPDIFWVDPEARGILPLDRFHITKSLRKVVRQDRFRVTADTAFREVMEGCAESAFDRPTTWINARILDLYGQLFEMGHAHSVECWADGDLAGGLYGVSLGRAFFGESMFSRYTDASKVALVHLVARLIEGGFVLLDTQFVTEHLRQFGALSVPREQYHRILAHALDPNRPEGDFHCLAADFSGSSALQSISHTS